MDGIEVDALNVVCDCVVQSRFETNILQAKVLHLRQ
jgi:hypothetical protein